MRPRSMLPDLSGPRTLPTFLKPRSRTVCKPVISISPLHAIPGAMNKKTKAVFVCSECGEDFPRWQGRCTSCGAWNTLSEFKESRRKGKRSSPAGRRATTITTVAETVPAESSRIQCRKFPEINKVLGGGLVPGAVILLGGDPGIGKSTLLVQLMADWSAAGEKKVLYVSGEESVEQLSIRAQRCAASASGLALVAETSIETVLAHFDKTGPEIVVVDSIQTMYSEQLDSAPGSVSQIRECGALLQRYAKDRRTAVFLVGHVTKDGAIAGPRLLEHMVDTVLYFEGDNHYQYRIVRAVKNRFGPSGEIAILSMADNGLAEVGNPSEIFLLDRAESRPGTAIVPIIEGSRVLVVELQALVNRSHFGLPQRVASGINPKKLSLLLAVLERFGGTVLGDHDVFFNIAGGLSVTEPAIDLGIAAAVTSSFMNKPIPSRSAFIGEIGLGGEIRPVGRMDLRVKELARLGFVNCYCAKPPKQIIGNKDLSGTAVHYCRTLGEMKDRVF
ncbi:MAG: DNA repair protein RadA [Chitinivibrionales bacterium]|nr:DNA repair protein RadA [Chitinivibrionales bacterium]